MLQLPSGQLRMGSSHVTDTVLLRLAGRSSQLCDLDISGANITLHGLSALAASIADAVEAGHGSDRAAAGTVGYDTAGAEQTGPGLAPPAAPSDAVSGHASEPTAARRAQSLPLKRLYISRCRSLARDAGLQMIGELCCDTLEDLVVRTAGVCDFALHVVYLELFLYSALIVSGNRQYIGMWQFPNIQYIPKSSCEVYPRLSVARQCP